MGLIVVATAYSRSGEALKQSVVARLQVAASIKERELMRWDENQRQLVEILSQEPSLLAQAKILLTTKRTEERYLLAHDHLGQYFKKIFLLKPDIEKIDLLTSGGIIIFSTDENQEGKYQALGYSTTYFSSNWSDHAILNYHADAINGKAMVTLATPIHEQSGHRLAVLAVSLNLQTVESIMREHSGLGKSGETYVVSSLNTKYMFLSSHTPNTIGAVELHSQGINAALNGEKGSALYANYAGTPVIGLYQWLPNQNLALLAEISQQEAFAPAYQLAGEIFLVCSTGAGLLIMVIWMMARKIANPILAITQTAKTVAAGNLSAIAPVFSDNEVGTLAHTFNNMVAQLRISQEEKERKNLALERSEKQLRLALEAASMGIWDWDLLTNTITLTNNYNYSEQQVLQADEATLFQEPLTTFLERIHPDDQEFVRQGLVRSAAEGMNYNDEFRMITPGASSIHSLWLTAKGKVIYNDQGKAVRMLGAMVNINDRKHAEDALILNEKRWRILVQHSSEIISVIGKDYIIQYQSPAIEVALGYKERSLIGQPCLELIHPEDRSQVFQAMASLYQAPNTFVRFVHRLKHRNGSWRIFLSTVRNLQDESAISGIIIYSQDLAERNELKEKLQTSNFSFQTLKSDPTLRVENE
jgi:PAS domain S-box-containing protein